MKKSVKNIVIAAFFAALVCVATIIIKVPSPKGYINLGDGIILVAASFLSPLLAFFSAAIGSALADIFSGYIVYAPVTFLIKGLMAVLFCAVFSLLHKRLKKTPSQIIAAIIAESFMIFGYFIFETFLYGVAISVVNIPLNSIQAAFGIVVGLVLTKALSKQNLEKFLK